MLLAANEYIAGAIGQRFIDSRPLDLKAVEEEASCRSPIIAVLSQGSDPTALMSSLLDASKHARGSVDGGGLARLLEAAATSIQQLQAEASVQRGLAVASQTLATELALKIEQLQV